MEALITMILVPLCLFLAVIIPMAAWKISNDLPKIVNRLNTIIEILNQKGVMK